MHFALVWLREEDWPAWLAIDPDLEPHYQGWLIKARRAFQRHSQAGAQVRKVMIEPGPCQVWADSLGRKVDAETRAAYAAWLLSQTLEPGPRH